MRVRRRTGVAAILTGVLFFAGQGGQLVFGDAVPDAVYVPLGVGGFVALAVALWGLRELIAGTRLGRLGIRAALVGVAFLCLFGVQLLVEVVVRLWGARGSSPSWPSPAWSWRSS